MKNEIYATQQTGSALFRLFSALGLFAAILLGSTTPVNAKAPVNTGLLNNVAIKGYDPVAYFIEAKPVKGSKKFRTEWKGAHWHFSSETNKKTFEANPEAYAPQYGGYCAWAVSQGYTAGIDPAVWDIIDGKLYLNYNKSVQADWSKGLPHLIDDADKNWPEILKN